MRFSDNEIHTNFMNNQLIFFWANIHSKTICRICFMNLLFITMCVFIIYTKILNVTPSHISLTAKIIHCISLCHDNNPHLFYRHKTFQLDIIFVKWWLSYMFEPFFGCWCLFSYHRCENQWLLQKHFIRFPENIFKFCKKNNIPNCKFLNF